MTSGLDSLLVAAEYLEKLEKLNGNQLLSLENTSCNFPYAATDESNGSSSGSAGSDGGGGSGGIGSASGHAVESMRNSFAAATVRSGSIGSAGGGGVLDGSPTLSSSFPVQNRGTGGVDKPNPLDSNLALSVQFHSYSSVNYPPNGSAVAGSPAGGTGGGAGGGLASSVPSVSSSGFGSMPSIMLVSSSGSVGNKHSSPGSYLAAKKRQHSITSASSVKSSASNRSQDQSGRGGGSGGRPIPGVGGGHRTRTDSEQSSSSYSRHREMHKNLEKHRRAQMRQCFDALRRELPPSETADKKTSHINIIRCAIRTIQQQTHLTCKMEQEIDRLAREKIQKQQLLASLKDDLIDLGLSVSEIDCIDAEAEKKALKKIISDPDRLLAGPEGATETANMFNSSSSSATRSSSGSLISNGKNNGKAGGSTPGGGGATVVRRVRNSNSVSSNTSMGNGVGGAAGRVRKSGTVTLPTTAAIKMEVKENGVIQMAPAGPAALSSMAAMTGLPSSLPTAAAAMLGNGGVTYFSLS